MKRNMISVLVVIGMFVGMIQGQKYQCPDAPEKIGDRRKDKNVLRVVQYNAGEREGGGGVGGERGWCRVFVLERGGGMPGIGVPVEDDGRREEASSEDHRRD